MDFGHLKISRKTYAEDPLWNERRTYSRWEAWEDLMQSAAFQSYERMTSAGIIRLERGEVLASLRYLASKWNWTVKRVRTFLRWLSDDGRVRAQREAHPGTVYLIATYDDEQRGGTPKGTVQGTPKIGKSKIPDEAQGRLEMGTPEGTEAESRSATAPNTYEPDAMLEGTPKGTAGAHQGHTRGTNNKAVKQLSSTNNSPTQRVLDHFKATHPRRKVGDEKQRKVVEKSLKLGFSAEDLCNAISGNAADPWHSERRKHELSYVLRDADHINSFIEKFQAQQELVDPEFLP